MEYFGTRKKLFGHLVLISFRSYAGILISKISAAPRLELGSVAEATIPPPFSIPQMLAQTIWMTGEGISDPTVSQENWGTRNIEISAEG